jgi:hypothetical protein
LEQAASFSTPPQLIVSSFSFPNSTVIII